MVTSIHNGTLTMSRNEKPGDLAVKKRPNNPLMGPWTNGISSEARSRADPQNRQTWIREGLITAVLDYKACAIQARAGNLLTWSWTKNLAEFGVQK